MNIDKYFERIERIDQLIRLKATGSPKEFARKLEISKTWLYEYLKYLKNKGVPIEFDKERNSFYYTEEVEFLFKFNKLKKEQLEKIIGGEKIFSEKVHSSLIVNCEYLHLSNN
jgi:predicted DNA-binding transcriptional regulator YafY